jgi:hypothetical protein
VTAEVDRRIKALLGIMESSDGAMIVIRFFGFFRAVDGFAGFLKHFDSLIGQCMA